LPSDPRNEPAGHGLRAGQQHRQRRDDGVADRGPRPRRARARVGVTFQSAGGAGWTCDLAGSLLTCARPDLAPGDAPPITLVVTAPTAPGTLTNTATVSAETPDPDPTNNTSTATTTVRDAVADLAVTLAATPDPVATGAPLSYDVTVTSAGPDDAPAATVHATLPAGVAIVSAAGTGWSCTVAAPDVTCTRALLAAGATATVTIVVTAPGLAGFMVTPATAVALLLLLGLVSAAAARRTSRRRARSGWPRRSSRG
jgi:uncharacterized repeat protein (TIGR01451 family)